MNATEKTIRHLKKFRDLDSAIASLEARVRASKKARIPKPAPPGKDRDARRAERNERAAEIRAAVMERAAGKCEWCHREHMTLEWHHLRGAGERRSAESIENTVGICFDCHRMWERNPRIVYPMAKEHAIRAGMRDGLRAIEHRIAKVNEAHQGGNR